MTAARHRATTKSSKVVGFSLSYQRDNLLARGLGLEHLRELLLRLARPLLRHGVNLAYGGHWKETEDNFTYDLLRLISNELEDQNTANPDDEAEPIGRMFNHVAWPHYLGITPAVEAQWVNCCRIVRVSQADAGVLPDDTASDDEASAGSDRAMFNAAATLSGMRRLAMSGTTISIPGRSRPEMVPRIDAKVILGGKLEKFSGWLPGIFEEALLALENNVPLYILGGFGGAAEVLGQALLSTSSNRPEALTKEWLTARCNELAKLLSIAPNYPVPFGVRTTESALDDLVAQIQQAHTGLSNRLNTGLDELETQEVLETRDMRRAVFLVRKGLAERFHFEDLLS